MTGIRSWFRLVVGLILIVVGICWIVRPRAFDRLAIARTPAAIRASGAASIIIGLVFFLSEIYPE